MVEAKMSESKEKILSKKLLEKVVVSKSGKKFGEVGDLIFDTKTGEILDFTIINPTKYVKDVSLEKDTNGDFSSISLSYRNW